MAINSDAEKLALAEIGYMDMDRAVYLYLLDHPDEKSAPIAELLKPENHYLSEKEIEEYTKKLGYCGFFQSDNMKSWRIAAVHDTNDLNGFYACAVETSQNPPEVTLAFRGSGNFLDPHDFATDWAAADFALVHSKQTVQEAEAERFMLELKDTGFFDQYEGINFDGHSLGGALADYSCIISYDLGLSDKVTGCYNLDGPGHGKAFIEDNKEAIEHMGDKMDHYVWSTIGTQLYNIEGVHQHYVEVHAYYTQYGNVSDPSNVFEDLKDLLFWSTSVNQHAREATVLDGNGNFSTISKEQFLEQHEHFNGGFSCFLSEASYYLEPLMSIVGPTMSIAGPVILMSLPVVGPIYAAYKIYEFGSGLFNYLFGKDDDETPEEKAQREATEAATAECSQYIGFEIDPLAFLRISSNLQSEAGTYARELKYKVQEIREPFYSNGNNTMLFATMLTTGSFDTSAIYNNTELVNLKQQIKEQMTVVSNLKRSAAACDAAILQIQETIKGMITYLSQTGTAFQNIEKDAQARAASWPK